jgi:DNA repair ATPase RecN
MKQKDKPRELNKFLALIDEMSTQLDAARRLKVRIESQYKSVVNARHIVSESLPYIEKYETKLADVERDIADVEKKIKKVNIYSPPRHHSLITVLSVFGMVIPLIFFTLIMTGHFAASPFTMLVEVGAFVISIFAFMRYAPSVLRGSATPGFVEQAKWRTLALATKQHQFMTEAQSIKDSLSTAKQIHKKAVTKLKSAERQYAGIIKEARERAETLANIHSRMLANIRKTYDIPNKERLCLTEDYLKKFAHDVKAEKEGQANG